MLKVLRIGHRPSRDKRVTTHVALVARALGADGIYLHSPDAEIEKTVRSLISRFGGRFEINSLTSWRKAIEQWKGIKVHLTMYGLPIEEVIEDIRGKDALVIVGAEKVPADLYKLADFNVSISNQPHSEVAALALFLDRYFGGEELKKEFEGGMFRIIPNPRGKTVAEIEKKE